MLDTNILNKKQRRRKRKKEQERRKKNKKKKRENTKEDLIFEKYMTKISSPPSSWEAWPSSHASYTLL